jgi:hypothetical protein
MEEMEGLRLRFWQMVPWQDCRIRTLGFPSSLVRFVLHNMSWIFVIFTWQLLTPYTTPTREQLFFNDHDGFSFVEISVLPKQVINASS